MRRLLPILLCTACASDLDRPYDDLPPDPPSDPPVRHISVTLDRLEPGWHVTTSRLTDHLFPDERTLVADGSPITLEGTDRDVFVATITDAAGLLIQKISMKAPCPLAGARPLDVPHDYPTIQAAIDAASPGDTVRVAAGEYTESLVMREGVCLLGAGAKRTFLDGRGEGRSLVDLSHAPGSVVSGFTIRNTALRPGCASKHPFTCSGNWYTAGVYLGASASYPWSNPTATAPPLIVNNIFDSNYVGVMLYFHGIAVVRNNVFVNNTNGFIANHYQDRTLIANNVFIDNSSIAIGNQAAYLDIVDNIIVGSDIGILFEYVQTGHIACNVFHGNGTNQDDVANVPPRFAIGQNGNVEAEPHFAGNGDYHLAPSSPGKGKGCHGNKALQIDGSLPDIGAYGGPLASWVEL